MTDQIETLQERLGELRDTFDLAFIGTQQTRALDPEELLAIEIAGHPYALRVRELHGLYVDRAITELPDAPPELLGLAAVRGDLVAVYELASVLGYPCVQASRFIALCKTPALALAFGSLTGHLRAPRSAIRPATGTREPWFSEVVREFGSPRPILELTAVSAAIARRLPHSPHKENE